MQTARYPKAVADLACTEDDCAGPGTWVEAFYLVDPEEGVMRTGWEGDAWCDEHRPEEG